MKISLNIILTTAALVLSVLPEGTMGVSVKSKLSKRQRCLARPKPSGNHGGAGAYPQPSYSAPAPPPAEPTTTFEPAPAPTTEAPPPPPKTTSEAPKAEPTTQPAPAPPSSGGGDNGNQQPTSSEQAYLDPQNTIRASKHAPAFTWNDTLAAYAQQVADTCVFKHSGGPYGENLSAGTHPMTPAAAIKLWTDEEKDYNPSNPVFSHYTQVVWKGSREVGCAVTKCASLANAFSNADYYVCEYFPAGNVIGRFSSNVEA